MFDTTLDAAVSVCDETSHELVDRAKHSGEAPARVADQWARSLLQVRWHCELS